MRIWSGDDAHALELLERPAVAAHVSLLDTGWMDSSTGGVGPASIPVDVIPAMTTTTVNGVTVTAQLDSGTAWKTADDDVDTLKTIATADLPSWLKVDFGAGHTKTVATYTIRAPLVGGGNTGSGSENPAPQDWKFYGNDVDTGTGWTLLDSGGQENGWASSEKRTYTVASPGPYRFYRWMFTEADATGPGVGIAEVELLEAVTLGDQVLFQTGTLILDATAIGSRAIASKRVIVDTGDAGVEHGLVIHVDRGPVTLRVGSTNGDDDYINDTELGTGYHNLALTPIDNFYISLQSDYVGKRSVAEVRVAHEGTVEVPAPWADATDLNRVRFDQSADVVFVDAKGVHPQKIERRGTGRSWSVVEYQPEDGPFLAGRTTRAKLSVSGFYGNTYLTSDISLFTPDRVGALFRVRNNGQNGLWPLGAQDAKTDPIEVTGIGDTGTTPPNNSERHIRFEVTGTYSGRVILERSIDDIDFGYKPVPQKFFPTGDTGLSSDSADTGTVTFNIFDQDDNLKVWYRLKMASWTSGVAIVNATYMGGGVQGVGRVTEYITNKRVGIEVLSRFSDTGQSDSWAEGYWSDHRGFPHAPQLHDGRLCHAGAATFFASVSDDFESFDTEKLGDAGPIIKTLGSGPVDTIQFLCSGLRLVVGTAGSELTVRSSNLDEPLTPSNSSASKPFSSRGAGSVRAVKLDQRALYIDRTGRHLTMAGPSGQGGVAGDYDAINLSILVPELLRGGDRGTASVVSIAIQRHPDSRIHCVLSDGTVGILTYEPDESVICWTTWETDGFVERAMVLPGTNEDAVYYHIRRQVYRVGNSTSNTNILLAFAGGDGSTEIVDTAARLKLVSVTFVAMGSTHSWSVGGNAYVHDNALVLDGSGSYVTHADDADFDVGSGDWAIDVEFECEAVGGAIRYICGQCDSSNTAASRSVVLLRSAGNVLVAQVRTGAGSDITVTGTTQLTDALNTGTHHAALVRSSGTLSLYLDGVLEGSQAISGSVRNSSNRFSVGAAGELTSSTWLGKLARFRLTIGVAPWTAAFTPPPAALPYGPSGEAVTVRYLEKWAKESECVGDTGLSYVLDCAASRSYYSVIDLGNGQEQIIPARSASHSGFSHLSGRQLIAWADDTGAPVTNPWAPDAGKDLSPDVNGEQVMYTVDTGTGVVSTGNESVHHLVAGLPYASHWKSTKLSYGARAGTALTQLKRTPQISFILYRTHTKGLRFGPDTGHLVGISGTYKGAPIDPGTIYETFDEVAITFPSKIESDARVHLMGKAPRPLTVLAAIPNVDINEKV